MAEASNAEAELPPKRHVVYCGVCMMPPEYCEFGGTVKKCEEWLQNHHPDMHGQIYSAEAVEASMAQLSVSAREKAAKDAAKKEAKAEAAEAKAASARNAARVIIKRVERNKRKFVTAVSGLEAFDLDLKKVGRDFGKKFATGSSVTKTPQGGEEIVVQGDLSDEIYDYLVDDDAYAGKIPEDNIDCVDDRKKKG